MGFIALPFMELERFLYGFDIILVVIGCIVVEPTRELLNGVHIKVYYMILLLYVDYIGKGTSPKGF